MNQYGARASKHWQQNLPEKYAKLTDPESFFTQLGERVEEEIEAMAETLAGQDPPGETYLGKTGRLTEARATAESTVLRELVLLPEDSSDLLPEQNHTR